MSTKAQTIVDPESCLNRAKDDEPIFVLRANDPIAADVVLMWANKYKLQKRGFEAMTDRQRAKFHDALNVSRAMRDWHFDDEIPF